MMDKALYDQTVSVAKTGGVIKADPSADAYRTDLAEAALKGITETRRAPASRRRRSTVTEGGN